jgi:hypothetical protein
VHVEGTRFGNVALHVEIVAHTLAALDVDRVQRVATETERRELIDPFLEVPLALPDYVDVTGLLSKLCPE